MDRIQKLIAYAKKQGLVANDWTQVASIASEYAAEKKKVALPKDVHAAISSFGFNKTEQFIVVMLDGAHHILESCVISSGLVNRTVVHPREVFRPAILANSCAVVIAHNHPSGSLEPSPEDIEITRRLEEAGKIVGIDVLDHLIISRGKWLSFKERGIM